MKKKPVLYVESSAPLAVKSSVGPQIGLCQKDTFQNQFLSFFNFTLTCKMVQFYLDCTLKLFYCIKKN